MITARFDADSLTKALGQFEDQAPFILQTAINNTLKDVQEANISRINDRFTVRRQRFVKNSVKISKFAKKNDLTGIIEIADIGGKKTKDIFGKFETGGVKPATGRVAVPTDYIQPSKGRVITQARRPRNLKNSFIQNINGKDMVMQRKGRGKKETINVAYVLKDSVRVDARLGFVDTGMKTIDRVGSTHLEAAINRALKTARL